MKRIFKKRFSMMEVAGLLSILLLGIGLYAWAATTVPYSFTAGSTAIATQVNANFNTLATAIDSVDSSVTPDQIRDKFYSGTSCAGNGANDIMVKVGPLCVDVFEASVWSNPDGTGIQYGTASDNYPTGVTAFPDSGNWTGKVYALSMPGKFPATYITWFQAQQACALSDKRLLTNAEWQMAAAGTPDPGTDDLPTDCNITPATGKLTTGSRSACVSKWGIVDMVGNVSEWVADWIQGYNSDNWNTGAITTDPYGNSDAIIGINEGLPADGFPVALIRGGDFNSNAGAGVFAMDATHGPSFSQNLIGFRCAR